MNPLPTSTPAPAATASVARFNPWPYALIAFFAVAILGTATLVYISVTNSSDLVAKDYYDQEMRYQGRLDQLHRTQPLEDRIGVEHAGDVVRLRLPKEHAAGGAAGTVSLYRPSAAGADKSYPLALDGEGRQALSVSDLGTGLWKVRIQWKVGVEEYYTERNLVLVSAVRPAAGGVRR
jgi:nitrogen fixation protein FixH